MLTSQRKVTLLPTRDASVATKPIASRKPPRRLSIRVHTLYSSARGVIYCCGYFKCCCNRAERRWYSHPLQWNLYLHHAGMRAQHLQPLIPSPPKHSPSLDGLSTTIPFHNYHPLELLCPSGWMLMRHLVAQSPQRHIVGRRVALDMCTLAKMVGRVASLATGCASASCYYCTALPTFASM